MNFFIKNKIELFILMILPVLFLYRMIFFGEIVTTNDELERHPINEWRDAYLDENKDTPQWYPNLFSGMPSYGGYIYTSGDPTKYFRSNILFNNGFTHLRTSLTLTFINGVICIGIFLIEPNFKSFELTSIYILINIFWLIFFEYFNRRAKN